MSSIYHTRNVFLKGMALVYLFAFTSFYLQIRGLYGTNGILPAHARLNLNDQRPLTVRLWESPTLLLFTPLLGLNVSYGLELISLSGILLSSLGFAFQKFCNAFLFFLLWMLYLSIYQVGQVFMYFQWDIMLLESGCITILVAPILYSTKSTMPRDRICFWLIKWLFFRLMFASGVVKLTSKCPTWWGLTALTVHYESQCIPTTLAWYFHHLPVWFHKLSVVATLVIEIILPFLFFLPFRTLRLFACYGQILLQGLIIASGNYNFFNILTLMFCFSLIDDKDLFSRKPYRSNRIESLFSLIFFVALGYILTRYFGISIGGSEDLINSEIKFSYQEFEDFLKYAVPASILIGAISLIVNVGVALFTLIFYTDYSFVTFIVKALHFIVYLATVTFFFGISLVPYSSLDQTTHASLPPILHSWYREYNRFHFSSSYGLFRSMTGVGGRPEVVLEGAKQLEGPWIEIPFKYKPGALDRACPFIVPHQPRLDWQMWFAALGSYHQNSWLTSLSYRILTNETEVIDLLDKSIFTEFEDFPPKYIKGTLYKYYYTSPNEKNTINSFNWWYRKRIADYLPIFTADHQPLIDYLKRLTIIGKKERAAKNKTLIEILDKIWDLLHFAEPHAVIWGLLISSILISRIY